MSRTARDLCESALKKINVTSQYDDPTGTEIVGALEDLNDIIDQWNNDNLWPYSNRREEWTIDPSTRVYKVGPASIDPSVDIDTERPLEIQSIYLDFDSYTRPLQQESPGDWDRFSRNLTLTSVPDKFTYRPDYPIGTLELDSFPDKSYTATVQMSLQIVNYDLDDVIDLPSGYYSTLKFALAAILCPQYDVDPNTMAFVLKTADSRLSRLKRQNYKPSKVDSDWNNGSARYNIYTDNFDTRNR